MLVTLAAGLSWVVRFPPVIRAGINTFTAIAAASLVTAFVASDRLPALAGRVISLVSASLARRVSGMLEHVMSGMRNTGGRASLLGTLLFSVGIWGFAGLATVCNLHAFGLPVPWYAGFFVMLVINLGGVIPSSPGGIGVYHYLAVLALSVWVTDSSAALAFAVVVHAIGLALTTLLGLGSLASQHESLFRVARTVQEGAGHAA
jgi:hypothetical protein